MVTLFCILSILMATIAIAILTDIVFNKSTWIRISAWGLAICAAIWWIAGLYSGHYPTSQQAPYVKCGLVSGRTVILDAHSGKIYPAPPVIPVWNNPKAQPGVYHRNFRWMEVPSPPKVTEILAIEPKLSTDNSVAYPGYWVVIKHPMLEPPKRVRQPLVVLVKDQFIPNDADPADYLWKINPELNLDYDQIVKSGTLVYRFDGISPSPR